LQHTCETYEHPDKHTCNVSLKNRRLQHTCATLQYSDLLL
jgi:hypothetical protein